MKPYCNIISFRSVKSNKPNIMKLYCTLLSTIALLSQAVLYSKEELGGELTLFAQGRNLLDEDIRRHTSFIKDKAPLPGSSVNVGLSYKF